MEEEKGVAATTLLAPEASIVTWRGSGGGVLEHGLEKRVINKHVNVHIINAKSLFGKLLKRVHPGLEEWRDIFGAFGISTAIRIGMLLLLLLLLLLRVLSLCMLVMVVVGKRSSAAKTTATASASAVAATKAMSMGMGMAVRRLPLLVVMLRLGWLACRLSQGDKEAQDGVWAALHSNNQVLRVADGDEVVVLILPLERPNRARELGLKSGFDSRSQLRQVVQLHAPLPAANLAAQVHLDSLGALKLLLHG